MNAKRKLCLWSTMFLSMTAQVASSAPGAASFRFESGQAQVNIVELFSSEGCSSCPPADAWIAGLRQDKNLWHRFVPIEFHVDYWNRLGWQDRFSRRTFTDRQKAYANAWHIPSLYTPGFAFNGREWRPDGVATEALAAGAKAAGDLTVSGGNDGRVTATFRPLTAAKVWTAHLALLGNGLISKVTSGENNGETLHHEFVVLNLQEAPLKMNAKEGTASFTLPQTVPAKSYSIAAWVTEAGSVLPVQAVGGDLPQR